MAILAVRAHNPADRSRAGCGFSIASAAGRIVSAPATD